MTQSQDPGHGILILKRNPDTGFVSHAGDEVVKPFDGLRRQPMTRPGLAEQTVQFGNQGTTSAYFILETFTLRAPDLSLDAIFMEVSIEGI
jgi:hypothetical protein